MGFIVWVGILLGSTLCCEIASAASDPGLSAYLADAPAWIEAVGTTEEARLFRALTDDVQRERFLHGFWRTRGLAGWASPVPTVPTEAEDRELWDWARRLHLRLLDARVRFDDLSSAQARVYMQAGAPAREVAFGGCRGIVRPIRMWWYDEYQAADLVPTFEPTAGFWRVFIRDYAHAGDFRDWWPGDGIEALSESDAPYARSSLAQILDLSREGGCFRKGESEAKVLEEALQTAWSPERLTRLLRERAPDPVWLDDFVAGALATAAASTGPSSGDAAQLGRPDLVLLAGVALDLRAAGSVGRETVVRGRFTVPIGGLRGDGSGRVFDRLTVRGEAVVGASVVDGFEHVFQLVGRPASERIEFDVWRRLRPGDQRLRLRLEDASGRALLAADRWVRIPHLDTPPPSPTGHVLGLAGLTRERVSTLVTFPEIQIVSPGVAQVGEVDLEVRAVGGRAGHSIDRVDVRLDGRHAGSVEAAPWSVRLDLGDEPAPHAVEAVAFDAEGRELSRDALRLDPGPRPLQVRLDLLREAGVATAEATVTLPRDASIGAQAEPETQVRRVEIFLGERLIGAFRRPPYRVELPAEGTESAAAATFVRAVVRLDDGRQAEDFHFLRGQGVESLDVRLVEVWATVLDSRDRPVTRLGPDDFRLRDEGEVQTLHRADMVTDLPIRVALVMDTSTSMRDKLPVAVASAREFFDTVVTPQDAAALLTFDHRLRLRTPFTAEPSRLALGAGGLEATGGTRLHDGLVWSLGYLGVGADRQGSAERRALVLLTDGRDVGSDASFEEALEQAVESGVAVYPILLAIGDAGTHSDLVRIARESGGAAFAIDNTSDLGWVYDRIEEELRSQYLLVYTSPGTRRGTFHRIEVELTRPGLTARTVRGYYR